MKRIVMLCAAFAAVAAGAKDALADDCSFISAEYDRLSPELREEAEVVALTQHLTERCRSGATTAAAAVAQLRAQVAQLQTDLADCLNTVANVPGCNPGSDRVCQLTCERTGGTFANGRCGQCPRGKVPRGRCSCGARRVPPPPPTGPVTNVFCPEGTARVGQSHPGDRDCDGIVDALDNCPETHNPGQEDYDRDGIGASCDDRDDLAVHGAQLDPLAARIAELERAMREHSHPGSVGPIVVPPTPVVNPDDWRSLFVLRDEFNRLATRVDGHDSAIADLDSRLRGLEGRVTARLNDLERGLSQARNRLAQHQSRLDEHDARLDGHDREIRRQDGELGDIRRMFSDLRARVFPYFWVDGAVLVFPGSGDTVVAPTAEFGLRIATFGPFAVSGSIGFGAADGEFALYFGGLGEFLLNDPNRPAHFSLGLGFAAFANEARAFGDDQYGWRGVYLEPAAFIRLGDGERAPRIRLAIRAGLGQSFWRQNAPTEWGQAGMFGASLGIAFRGL